MQALSLATTARAESPAAAETTQTVARGGTNGTDQPLTAQIILVGELADDRELSDLIQELLDREDLRAQIARASRLEPDALLATGGREPLVLVSLTDPHHAKLQFRGLNGERYLLRKLILPGGLDVVGRESIGQVIESSVVALLRTGEGLSREEVARELVQEAAAEPRPPAPRTYSPPTRLPPIPASAAWQPRLALRYAARWSGSALGVAHGPGLVTGVRWGRSARFGAELGVERSFTQTLSTPELSADVQVSAVHALFELGVSFGPRHALRFALGPALDLSRVNPVRGTTEVALAASQLDTIPACRGELRYEFSGSRWSVGAAAALDVSLIRLHYELAGSSTKEELASPSVVRPGVVLSLGLH